MKERMNERSNERRKEQTNEQKKIHVNEQTNKTSHPCHAKV
jgi:hypothetical protein